MFRLLLLIVLVKQSETSDHIVTIHCPYNYTRDFSITYFNTSDFKYHDIDDIGVKIESMIKMEEVNVIDLSQWPARFNLILRCKTLTAESYVNVYTDEFGKAIEHTVQISEHIICNRNDRLHYRDVRFDDKFAVMELDNPYFKHYLHYVDDNIVLEIDPKAYIFRYKLFKCQCKTYSVFLGKLSTPQRCHMRNIPKNTVIRWLNPYASHMFNEDLLNVYVKDLLDEKAIQYNVMDMTRIYDGLLFEYRPYNITYVGNSDGTHDVIRHYAVYTTIYGKRLLNKLFYKIGGGKTHVFRFNIVGVHDCFSRRHHGSALDDSASDDSTLDSSASDGSASDKSALDSSASHDTRYAMLYAILMCIVILFV